MARPTKKQDNNTAGEKGKVSQELQFILVTEFQLI